MNTSFSDPHDEDSHATRRDTPDAWATRKDGSGLRATRKDGPSLRATRKDTAGATDPPQRSGAPTLMTLPTRLRQSYTIERQIKAGTEADLLLVHRTDDVSQRYMVKVYRPTAVVDEVAWAKLDQAPLKGHRRLVRTFDKGIDEASGRAFEVMEYAAARHLVIPNKPVSPDHIRTIVDQVTAALVALHRADIVHRDLKPENILLRRPPREGFDLALADFGLAREQQGVHDTMGGSGTTPYMAPELFRGEFSVSSPAQDWWALGIIVLELATGRRAFEHLDRRVVAQEIVHGRIDFDAVTDPRINLLCRGLLTWDHEQRWGSQELRRWFDGETPAVATSVRPTGPVTATFAYGGRQYGAGDRSDLAVALANDWPNAARALFAPGATGALPVTGKRLHQWLSEIYLGSPTDAAALQRLIDEDLEAASNPDIKLIALLRWLDADLTPCYRGYAISKDGLARLAVAVSDERRNPTPEEQQVLTDLYDRRLLVPLSAMSGGAELADLDKRWRRVIARHDQLIPSGAGVPSLASGMATTAQLAGARGPTPTNADRRYAIVLAWCLRLATDRTGTVRELQRRNADTTAATPQVPEYGTAVRGSSDPTRQLVLYRLGREALRLHARRQQQVDDEIRRAQVEAAAHAQALGPAKREAARTLLVPYGALLVGSATVASGQPLNAAGVTVASLNTLAAIGVAVLLARAEFRFARQAAIRYTTNGALYRPPRSQATLKRIGSALQRHPYLAIALFLVSVTVLYPLLGIPFLVTSGVAVARLSDLIRRRSAWHVATHTAPPPFPRGYL